MTLGYLNSRLSSSSARPPITADTHRPGYILSHPFTVHVSPEALERLTLETYNGNDGECN